MAGFVSVGTGATGTVLIVDAGYLVDRVANLLRRADMKPEILYWLDLAQKQLAHRAKFPELRKTSPAIAIAVDDYDYALPADFAQIDSVYYKATYASPAWGRGLTPLPRRFYGEPTDIQSRLDVPAASRKLGDPQAYLIQNKTLFLDSSPIADTFPAELYVTYYKSPASLTTMLDVPEIDEQWRQYLIWITLYWGKAAVEQEDVTKSIAWNAKAEKIMDMVVRKINTAENPREAYNLPDVGMEDSDEIY